MNASATFWGSMGSSGKVFGFHFFGETAVSTLLSNSQIETLDCARSFSLGWTTMGMARPLFFWLSSPVKGRTPTLQLFLTTLCCITWRRRKREIFRLGLVMLQCPEKCMASQVGFCFAPL